MIHSTPPPPHDYPYYWVILDPKSKEDKVKDTNLKNSPKFNFFKQTSHATYILKLLDNMCKYEMDPASIVEDTELTRFCPQTDRRTRWNQYTPFQLHWSGGYNKVAANERRHCTCNVVSQWLRPCSAIERKWCYDVFLFCISHSQTKIFKIYHIK